MQLRWKHWDRGVEAAWEFTGGECEIKKSVQVKDTEAEKISSVILVRDSVRNRMERQSSDEREGLNANPLKSNGVNDVLKEKMRVGMSMCACCGIAGHERHGGLGFIWPLGGNDENSIVVSGRVRTTKEVIQCQKDAVVTLDIEFSVEHPLFVWMVTDKPQEFLDRSLYRFGISHEYVTPLCVKRQAEKRESATSSNDASKHSSGSGLEPYVLDSLRRGYAESKNGCTMRCGMVDSYAKDCGVVCWHPRGGAEYRLSPSHKTQLGTNSKTSSVPAEKLTITHHENRSCMYMEKMYCDSDHNNVILCAAVNTLYTC